MSVLGLKNMDPPLLSISWISLLTALLFVLQACSSAGIGAGYAPPPAAPEASQSLSTSYLPPPPLKGPALGEDPETAKLRQKVEVIVAFQQEQLQSLSDAPEQLNAGFAGKMGRGDVKTESSLTGLESVESGPKAPIVQREAGPSMKSQKELAVQIKREARVCGAATGICDSRDSICNIAKDHPGASEFEETCAWATYSCAQANNQCASSRL